MDDDGAVALLIEAACAYAAPNMTERDHEHALRRLRAAAMAYANARDDNRVGRALAPLLVPAWGTPEERIAMAVSILRGDSRWPR